MVKAALNIVIITVYYYSLIELLKIAKVFLGLYNKGLSYCYIITDNVFFTVI